MDVSSFERRASDLELKRMAVALVSQLPEHLEDARGVLVYANALIDGFLQPEDAARSTEKPGLKLVT